MSYPESSLAGERKAIVQAPDSEVIDPKRIESDPDYKARLRWRAQTDLYWLATRCLVDDTGKPSYPNISPQTHSEVARFFVQKDPSKPIAEQDTVKQRLLLMPRGTFKTTFNIVDTVQWMLCFPDIGMFVMTASNTDDSPLADAFVEEVAGHFFNPHAESARASSRTAHFYTDDEDDKPARQPRLLHLLFPEYVITKMPKKGWFQSPARTKYRREPTLMGSSIESSLSGWHFDVIKFEDIQDNRNSQTPQAITKIKRNLFINLKMLMAWGYREGTGTRYGPMDVYGLVIERLDERVGKVLWKPSVSVKPEVWARRPALLEKAEDYSFLFENLEPEDWDLFFPEFLPWDKLMSARDEDESSFMTQMMNVATGNFKPIFPREKLVAATLDEEVLPITGQVSIKWRLEMSDSPTIAGAVGLLHDGRMYVVELVRGSYTPSTQALKIVNLAKKWSCHRISIEETPGARYQETAIRNEALRQRWELSINWTPCQDTHDRSLRIKGAEPLLATGRLYFSRGMKAIREVHRQLYHYGMIEDTEAADVVSRLCEELPRLIGDTEPALLEDDELLEGIRAKDLHDRVYGLGRYAPIAPQIAPELAAELLALEEDWTPAGADLELEEMMPGLTG